MKLNLANALGIAVLPAYLAITLLLGWYTRRSHTGANDFLNASRSLPLWIVCTAFLSVNCGALEIVGLSAVAAQYGAVAFHFYWVGAIPAMVFLAGVMLPVYLHCGARSLPEYLELRFDARMRLFNASLSLVAGVLLSGIGLYAMGQVLSVVFGWSFTGNALLASLVVLVYVRLGGLRAAIYNEVFQMFVIVLGLVWLLLLPTTRFWSSAQLPGPHWHLWQGLAVVAPHDPMDRLSVIAGLGFVLSFGYWCTDFVLAQRALAVRTQEEARVMPLLAGFGKLGFSLLVVAPSLGAVGYLGARMPARFDQTLPALMAASFSPLQIGLGMTALLASLMTALAANISAFSALWTQEIYRPYLHRGDSEEHYIRVARNAVVVATILSVALSYTAFRFRDLMEYVQMIFSFFNAPLFAVFVLGIFTRRTTARGAIFGLAGGASLAIAHHGLLAFGVLHYGSVMIANFYAAIYAFVTALIIGWLASRASDAKSAAVLEPLVWDRQHAIGTMPSPRWWALTLLLLAACAGLNYLWW